MTLELLADPDVRVGRVVVPFLLPFRPDAALPILAESRAIAGPVAADAGTVMFKWEYEGRPLEEW
jgi:hypothetical protein